MNDLLGFWLRAFEYAAISSSYCQ